MKLLYFGNPYVLEDSLAIRVADRLVSVFPKLEFSHIKDTFQLMDLNLSDSLLLDVADSITKPVLLSSDNVISSGASTTHDFDLGFYLKLSEKKADIICIPKFYSLDKAIDEVSHIIKKYQENKGSQNEI